MTEQQTKDFLTVKVVKAPDGQCPAWIREAWVGVELPVVDGKAQPGDGSDRHQVRVVDAVEALRRQGRESAALWWNDRVLARPIGRQVIFFESRDCHAEPRWLLSAPATPR